MNNYSNNKNRPQGKNTPNRPMNYSQRPMQNNPQRPMQNNGQRPVQRPMQRPSSAPKGPTREDLERMERLKEIRKEQRANRNYKITVFVASILVIILVLVMIVLAMRFSGCIGNDVQDETNSSDNPSLDNTNISSEALLSQTKDMGQSYLDSIIFVGDSNTAHMSYFGVLSGGKETEQIWVPESQTLMLSSEITSAKIVYPKTKEQLTIADAAGRAKPKYMVITLGTNGLSALDKDQFKYCYRKLIEAIQERSKETKIMVQSIFPVTSSYKKLSNERIDEANKWLLELAQECHVKYLDSCSVLKDSKGALIESYNSYHNDGYHLNKEAYEKILQYIRTHGYVD